MKITSAEYAAIRHRKRVRMLEQEVASQERAARRIATVFEFADEGESRVEPPRGTEVES